MPAISYSTLLHELENRRKVRTTRPYSEWWLNFSKGDPLYLYWKLRVSVEDKRTHKIGEGVLVEDPKPMKFLDLDNYVTTTLPITNETYAREEAFPSFSDLLEWFEDRYDSLYERRFVSLKWKWRG